MFVSPYDAARVSNAARRVGGYHELIRLNEDYVELKRQGKTPEIKRINGVWLVREKGNDHA